MKFLQKLMILVVAVFVAASSSVSVYALSDELLELYSQSSIFFYDGSIGKKCASGTISGGNVTIIGDSISVGAKSEYMSQIPNADFDSKTYNGTTYELIQVSKHFSANVGDNYSGMAIADAIQEQGDLRPYLVFALGTNDPGAVTDESIESLMELVGTNHKVVLTTNYALDNQRDYSVNNAAIRAAGEKYSNVAVADFAEEVAKNPTAYIEDKEYYVHPNAAGSKLFVKLIKEALNSLAGGVNGVATGSNRNYAGVQVWTDTEMQTIEKNVEIYQAAADEYGFPWQVLAVVHSLETGLRRWNPDNGQGIYQLYSYTDGGKNSNRFEPASEVSEAEFRRQTMIAAEVISGMAGDLSNPDNVKKLFFGYNGKAEQYVQKGIDLGFSKEQAENGEGSPYVMNRYDAERDPTSSGMSSAWLGRFVADGVYDPDATYSGFGAFVKYEALSGTSYCSSAGSSIVDTAIALSWEGYNSHDKNDPKPEYIQAMKEVGNYIGGTNREGVTAPAGASCDQFVSTVMRYSGSDKDFPLWGPGVQQEYMKSHTEMYMEIENKGDASNLEPGDIFVVSTDNGRHIYLYIGEIDGASWQASASHNGRTGEHYAGITYQDYDMEYSIYRRIN